MVSSRLREEAILPEILSLERGWLPRLWETPSSALPRFGKECLSSPKSKSLTTKEEKLRHGIGKIGLCVNLRSKCRPGSGSRFSLRPGAGTSHTLRASMGARLTGNSVRGRAEAACRTFYTWASGPVPLLLRRPSGRGAPVWRWFQWTQWLLCVAATSSSGLLTSLVSCSPPPSRATF